MSGWGGTPGSRRAARLGAAIAATLVLTGFASACSTTPGGTAGSATADRTNTAVNAKVIPLANFALPTGSWGCAPRTPASDGATSVPVVVSKVGTQVAILTNLCIDGSAPLPFVIDTGASQSEIDAALAARLHLPAAGAQQEIEGVGCTGPARPRNVGSWSWEGIALTGQVLMGVSIPGMGKAGQPVGLLGSDVLSRFGAVRFDFAKGTATVPGPEGPAPYTERTTQGPTSTPTPPALLHGTTAGTVPLTVKTGPGLSEVIASVRVGTHNPRPFAVDTGSSQTVVASSLSRRLGLRTTDWWERQTTVCSTITVKLFGSGPWAVGTVPLVRGPIATVDLGPVGYAGFVGLLGSDQLDHFGWVVFDYAGGRLVLGAK